MIKYFRPEALNQRHYFLTVLEAGKFKINICAGMASGEVSSWITDGQLLCVSLHGVFFYVHIVSSPHMESSLIGLGSNSCNLV